MTRAAAPLWRIALANVTALIALLILAACGGGASNKSGSTPTATPTRRTPFGGGAGFQPGTTGQVAAISGQTMQVQSPQAGQVAVKWTSRTTFSHPVSIPLS